jgi:DNA-binding NarL/FixJ family response regulator
MSIEIPKENSQPKVLIVDDEHIHIEIITDALEKEAKKGIIYEILQANQGNGALKIMEKYAIDLVITDWEMPQMNGLELIEQIRAKEDLDKTQVPIPIIMATGVMTKHEHLERALSIGANDFIKKPIDVVEIRARVHAALRSLFFQRQVLQEQQNLFEEKVTSLEELAYQINQKNKLISQLKKQASETQQILNDTFLPHFNKLMKTVNTELNVKKDWQKFDNQIQNLYPEFWQKLNEKYPELSRNERQLCLHVKNGKSSLEIAKILSVSVRTIETARYRLRKKLNIPPDIELVDFIHWIAAQSM